MRVVAGSAKGRRLTAVPGDSTRPILDRVKTALFDTLRPSLPGAIVLDLFAGSGGVGIEALSQGAAFCVFLDLQAAAVRTVRQNLETTGLSGRAEARETDAFSYLKRTRKSFDLLYVAPPQYRGIWIEVLHLLAERPDLLTEKGQIVVQIDPREYESLALTGIEETRTKKYGNTLLIFYRKRTAQEATPCDQQEES